MITRRDFLKYSAITGAAVALPLKFGVGKAEAYNVSPGIAKFTDPMRIFGVNIPLATPVAGKYSGVQYYEMTGGVFRDNLGTNMAAAFPGYTGTRFYGYADTATLNHVHLGGAVAVAKGTPVRLQFTNQLPATHIIPFDATIPQGQATVNQDHMAVHLHGGLVPWTSDGGPFHWFKPGAPATRVNGPSIVKWLPDNTGVLTDDTYYPNNQSARLMWYHDHAVGITRTNAYAGLATAYIIAEAGEPAPAPQYLVVQDKVFFDGVDLVYAGLTGAIAGDLWYPYIYDPKIWKLQGSRNVNKPGGLPVPSAVAEMFGDTMLVNGAPYPTYTISDTGGSRFRLLNACNARFLDMKFVLEDPAAPGEPLGGYLTPTMANVDVWVLGTEGGYLSAPVKVIANGLPNAPFTVLNPPLLIGPAERFDFVIDFSRVVGSKVLMYSDAQAPYPIGNPIFDFFPGNALNPAIVTPGFGPNTRTLMQFNVVAAAAYTPTTLPAPAFLPTAPDAINGGLTLNPPPAAGAIYNVGGVNYAFAQIRNLTLNETFDPFGRLMQLIGTTIPIKQNLGFGRAYIADAPTEIIGYNTVEIWNVYNLTADTHPMHVHLFNAMILSRRLFKVQNFNGIPAYAALGVGPTPNETGWKETFKMMPGEETKLAVLVEDPLPGRAVQVFTPGALPTDPPILVGTGTVPRSPRLLASYAITGDEYVWHCHILEHEEHDMMRGLVAI